MWRQMRVDSAYLERIRRALFAALLRGNRVTLAAFAALAVVMCVLAASGGDWFYAIFGVAMAGLLPLLLWRSSARPGARVPVGSFVAYAVTPDGTLHASGAQGTTTVNPGFVSRLAVTRDCWLIGLASGVLLVVPRELIPDADAALIVRHLPGRAAART
nr:hypothetical protein [Propionibacterium sp.]